MNTKISRRAALGGIIGTTAALCLEETAQADRKAIAKPFEMSSRTRQIVTFVAVFPVVFVVAGLGFQATISWGNRGQNDWVFGKTEDDCADEVFRWFWYCQGTAVEDFTPLNTSPALYRQLAERKLRYIEFARNAGIRLGKPRPHHPDVCL